MHVKSLVLGSSLVITLVALSVTLVFAANDVTSLTLINADTDTDIQTLSQGQTINLATLPTRNLNVRANTTTDVLSVRFGLDTNSNYKTESTSPFALAGDTNGNYNNWTPTVGTHTITATGYSGTSASGTAGAPLSVTFNVVDQPASTLVPTPTITPTAPPPTGGNGTVSGELKKWHKITVDFAGPNTSETSSPNPFLDYRLDVHFTHRSTGSKYIVPGYYAADGNAQDTSATSGNVWRVHFSPDKTGTWDYVASFRTGTNVAVGGLNDGSPTSFNGASGSFDVTPTDKTGVDLRGKGRLQYVGKHHMQFAENGEYFIKGGTDSPENLLAYADFDNTTNNGGYLKTYSAHVSDWKTGDPSWKNGKGKGLIGAVNYLASEGLNVFSFLTLTAPQGDDKNVFPFISTNASDFVRMDVSKLAQWETVFSHGDKMGMFLHFKTQETENDGMLDGGILGTQKKLYYRELIARFGHHLALNWNLGEEYDRSTDYIKQFSDYIKEVDPYDHLIVLHTYPGDYDIYYTPLLGYSTFDGVSMQHSSNSHSESVKWITQSVTAGRPWVVSVDESGGASIGIYCDADTNEAFYQTRRRDTLYANLMAGGNGVEWYFGYNTCESDLTLQDFRTRDIWWDYTRYATNMFRSKLPFYEMKNNDAILTGETGSGYVLEKPGVIYAIYLSAGGSGNIQLPAGTFNVQWFNPRTGTYSNGSVTTLAGSGTRSLGNPPSESASDWVVLVSNENYTGPSTSPTPSSAPKMGDSNADGRVNGADYVRWLNNFGKTTTNGASDGDYNGDGYVTGTDYVVWLNNYTG